jgi:hypothetical protein
VRRIVKTQLAHGAGLEIVRRLMADKEGDVMSFFDNLDPEKAKSSWPAGSYEATITKVEESLTKAHGDPMLIVTYTVYGAPGGPTRGKTLELKDYFTDPPTESGRKGSLWKLRALAHAVGLAEKFQTKTLRRKDLEGKNLIVELSSEYSEKYGDQNRVDSYTRLDRAPAVPVEDDEEVPF